MQGWRHLLFAPTGEVYPADPKLCKNRCGLSVKQADEEFMTGIYAAQRLRGKGKALCR